MSIQLVKMLTLTSLIKKSEKVQTFPVCENFFPIQNQNFENSQKKKK